MRTNATAHRRQRRGGFTLIELLVVIGIIVLLVGILTPMVMTSRRNAERVRARQDLNTIALALEQYKADFKDYPRPDPADPANLSRGVLAWALIGPWPAAPAGTKPGDGADGFGFRTQWNDSLKVGGKVWGPYLPPEKFEFENKAEPYHLVDRLGNRIEYFPRARSAKPTTPLFGVPGGGDPLALTVAPATGLPGTGTGVYDSRHTQNKEAVYYLQRALGDGLPVPGDPPTYPPHNDKIDGADKLLVDPPPFILMGRGYRKVFSSKDEVDKSFAKTSEVTNLQTP